MFGMIVTGMVLPDLVPISACHVVEAQRCTRRLQLHDIPLRLLAFGLLYGFRFAFSRAFGRAVKAMTSPLEVEEVVGRIRTFVDGHAGESLRV